MIWQVAVELDEVFAQGRGFAWPRPPGCLRCGCYRVWGHGFVGRYFDGFVLPLLLRCYRCPGCGCVMTPRPAGYVRRIRAALASIRDELRARLETGRWRSQPASRMRHWLGHLRRQALAWLGWTHEQALLVGFERLLVAGVVAVGRPIQTDRG